MRIQPGAVHRFSIDPGGASNSILLALSEPAGSDWVWEIRVEAKAERGFQREIGRVRTMPPAAGAPASRVIAIASAPGATDWAVEVRSISGTTPAYVEADLDASACPYLLGQPWQVIGGADWTPGARYYLKGHTLSSQTEQITIPAGVHIDMISAWSANVGGSITVTDPLTVEGADSLGGGGADDMIAPIPAGGVATLAPNGSLHALKDRTIAICVSGAGGYIIEGRR